MNKARLLLTLSVILALITLTGQLHAQSVATQFVPFREFIAGIAGAEAGEYVAQSGSRVQNETNFEEMRRHILTMYRDVEVSHSFVLGSDHFDCIPIEQQPSVRILGIMHIATPPPQSAFAPPHRSGQAAEEAAAGPTAIVDSERPFDEFGNSTACEANTIPMRRLTLKEMARFPTLRQFFQKGPDGAGRVIDPITVKPVVPPSHKYSFMYQNVNNLGGNSNLNLWSPAVNTTAGEIFSLSQEWYAGGSGTTLPGKQTAEVGWQNYPLKYGNQTSRLFIYWTADGYTATGCYNLECPGFVQTANRGDLGAGFPKYSVSSGSQYEVAAEYFFTGGDWWVGIQGVWIGYYPASIYHGGQLSHYATLIEFGSESVGTTLWPPEGSGAWSTTGFGKAAYQRSLFYLNTSSTSVWDSLTPSNPSPKCYSTSGPFYSSAPPSGFPPAVWGWYFYEGGPGGSGC